MVRPSPNSTRRDFLFRAGALAAAPLVLGACRRGRSPEPAATQPANAGVTNGPPHNLDDVGDLATFRPPLPPNEPPIRVRVLRVRDGQHAALRIGSEGQWLMVHGEAGPNDPQPARGAAVQGPLDVDMTDRGWSIVDAKGFRVSVSPHDTLDLRLLADDSSGLIQVSSSAKDMRAYPGELRLVSRHDLDEYDSRSGAVTRYARAFDVINVVGLETYLPGVLAGELYANWRPETFAAQAIAARSFACTEAAVFAGRRHYDVANNASSQMYLGDVRHDRAKEAVQTTRGRMLAFGGLLVSGYYSSCCGGAAASATDAIGSNPVNNAPPLRGRSGSDVCSDAAVFHWTIEQPLDQLVRRIAGYARDRSLRELEDLQRLASIDVSAVNDHGRPTRMAVVDQTGARVEMLAEDFRRAANFSSADGTIKPPEKELRSANVRTSIVGSKVIFEGYGFGHGVGLCQHGAESLARAGTSPDDILRWYYPQVDITSAYG